MNDVRQVLSLKVQLELALALQARALRRARNLRDMGASPRLAEALRDVDLQQYRVCEIEGELRRRGEWDQCLKGAAE